LGRVSPSVDDTGERPKPKPAQERERLIAFRTRAHVATSMLMVQCLRVLSPDGKTALFDREYVTSVLLPKWIG
jgi:hypothetical protein